jgi:hypothetical protein
MFSNDPLRTEFFAGNRYGLDHRGDPRVAAARAAVALYNRTCGRARWARIVSAVTGRGCGLASLTDVERECRIHSRHRLGIQSVPIRRICGSEERCGDFDIAFRPRNPACRGRWLNIAMARQLGVALPPVDLIQVEQTYYVRDGHHRVSVARAMGQEEIDAEIISWHVEFPESWSRTASFGFLRRSDRRRRPVRSAAPDSKEGAEGA